MHNLNFEWSVIHNFLNFFYWGDTFRICRLIIWWRLIVRILLYSILIFYVIFICIVVLFSLQMYVKYLHRATSPTRASHICNIILGQITLATSCLFRHSGMCIRMFVIPGEGTSIKDWHTRARTKYLFGGYLS